MFKSSTYFFMSIFTVFLLSACGVPGPGGGSTTSGDSSNSDDFNTAETVSVIIEDYEETGLEQINSLPTTAISIVELGADFSEQPSGDIPDYQVLRDGERYDLELSERLVERANIVLKVRFSNNKEVFAPLYSTASDSGAITVNVMSHYVLKKLFDTIDDDDQLDELLPCSGSSSCEHQSSVKATLLKSLSETFQHQEVFLNGSLTLSEAIDEIDQIETLRNQVETGVNEITRTTSPIKQGTARAISVTDGSIRSSLNIDREFNSLWFGISFNDLLPENALNEVIISTSNSEIIPSGAKGNTFPIYPYFTQTTSLLDIRRDSLSFDIFFSREALSINSGNEFSLINDEPFNNLAPFTISDSFLSTQSFLLNDRVPLQVIPGNPGDPKDIGWVLAPMFSKLYQVNEHELEYDVDRVNDVEEEDFGDSPTWLVNANYSGGASFQLSYATADTDKENPIRGAQQEQVNLFSWEIHGLETTEDFSRSDIGGREFGVIEYSLNLNDENNVLELNANTYHWDSSSTSMTQTQPGASDSEDQHYRSYQLSRNADLSRALTISSDTGSQNFGFYTVQTEEATQDDPEGNNPKHQGLMGLDRGSKQLQGHTTQNGKHLAFMVDTFADGRGLLIANELRPTSASPLFDGEVYQLMGNIIQIADNTNGAFGLINSSLTIQNISDPNIDCSATLNISLSGLEHTVSNNALSDPATNTQSAVSSTDCRIGHQDTAGTENGSEIELSFENVFGSDLTLKGFVTEQGDSSAIDNTPGNLINLLWIKNDQLGLVFAVKEQSLSPEFD